MLDAVCRAEFFEEHEELIQFFKEPVLIFSRGEGDLYHHVIEGVVEAVCVLEDDERARECRDFREETLRWRTPNTDSYQY